MSIEIYPVIHVSEQAQAIGQVALALEKGADGVFLIDHQSRDARLLLGTFDEASEQFPKKFVGLNFLQAENALEALRLILRAKNSGLIGRSPDGLWVDDAIPQMRAARILKHNTPNLKPIRYLGGVAFKYTRSYTEQPILAREEASRMSPYVDVITTSGPGTGQAPSAEKIQAMKEAIGQKPLAVASGIDINNLPDYAEWVDQLLVASSIETQKYSGFFDKSKLADLVEMAHALEKTPIE